MGRSARKRRSRRGAHAKAAQREKSAAGKRAALPTERREADERVGKSKAQVAELERRMAEVLSAETPVQRSAELLCEQFDGRPVTRGLAQMLAGHATSERAHAVAEAATRKCPATLTALTLAADVAYELDRDQARAGALLEQARLLADDAGQRAELAERMVDLSRAADALELVAGQLLEDPRDQTAQRTFARALEIAHARLDAHAGEGWSRRGNRCPCGSGRPWWNCCRRAERMALQRFGDRGRLDRLREALSAWIEREPALAGVPAERATEWVADAAGEEPFELGLDQELEAVATMAVEHAWLAGGEEGTEAEDPDADAPLARFARDPDVPPELAAAATRWLSDAAYGVWQMHDPRPRPGIWLTDILTGMRLYVAVPVAQLRGVARWTALLGPLVPVEGLWRTGAVLPLTPAEADRVAEIAYRTANTIASAVAGKHPRFKAPKPGREQPHGVLASVSEPVPPEVADLFADVLGSGIPQLVSELRAMRAAGPRLTNIDGEELCIVKAHVEVSDPARTARLLAAHLDVELEDDGVLAWWGRELDPEHETLLAELHERRSDEHEHEHALDEDAWPERWARARIRPVDGGFEVEVNSSERMTRVLELLRELGDEPAVREQLRLEPGQGMTSLRVGGVAPFGGSQEAIDSWLRDWPDQPVPALRGRTPRGAASREADRPRLEALLRELEHHACRLTRAELPAPDVQALREELELPAELWAP